MKKEIKSIIIDDEIANLNGIARKLEKHFPEIVITHKIQEPELAVEILQQETVDLVFLDIKMPRKTGFDVLTSLQHIDFELIFITAYNEYALEAFKHNAIAYVLKPIDDQDFVQAVDKAMQNIQYKSQEQQEDKLLQLLSKELFIKNKLFIPTHKGISFIPFEEIIRLEGNQGYTHIHLINNHKILSSYNIGKFEKMLHTQFYKCHKSHIVNLTKIRNLENEGYLVLDDESRIPITKSLKSKLLDLLK
jgi:two-component system LytT family response regulator